MVNRVLEHSFSTGISQVPEIKDLELNEPRIKISDSFNNFFTYSTSLFTYIAMQALSKVMRNPYQFSRYTIEGDGAVNQLDSYITATNGQYTICLVGVSISRFNNSAFQNYLKENSLCAKHFNEQINKTNDVFLGVAVKEHLILLFYEKGTNLIFKHQLYAILLIYKIILRETDERVQKFFNSIQEQFKTELNIEKLQEIYREYMTGLPEYILNRTSQIKNISKKIRNRQINTATRELEQLRSYLKEAMDSLSSYQKRFNTANEKLAILQIQTEDTLEDSLNNLSVLLENAKVIKDYQITDTSILLSIIQPTTINDKDNWQIVENNSVSDKLQRELLHKVFVDEEYIMYTSCKINLNIENNTVNKDGNYDTRLNTKCLPNPHIMGFNCFGQHTALIAQQLNKGDYDLAVEQIIEASAYINWADKPVINRLQTYLENFSHTKCFYDPINNFEFSMNDWRSANEANKELKDYITGESTSIS